MITYQPCEYYQLIATRTSFHNRIVSDSQFDIAINAIQSLLNIMIMINGEDDNRSFTAREIFDALYKDMR